MQIRIEGHRLPGRSYGCNQGVQVAVQRRNRPAELFGLHPGDAPSARWTLECTATVTPAGSVELTGPYIQGGPGARFVYLSWIAAAPDGGSAAPVVFRRAKLLLAAVPPDVVTAALGTGLLVARLPLTDAHGGPLCARVVPPLVGWTAGGAPAAAR